MVSTQAKVQEAYCGDELLANYSAIQRGSGEAYDCAQCFAQIILLLTLIAHGVYNLCLHPLSNFPGPRRWAISRLPYTRALWQGRLHIKIKEIHDRYGPVVRIAPDELSFIQGKEWYNFATFDIAGRLTLSEDFGCLQEMAYHPWILMVLTHFKASALVMCLRIYSPLDTVLIYFAPGRLLELKERFLSLVRQKIHKRLAQDPSTEKNDFVSAAMMNPKSGGMDKKELEANCILMILAGSETMATALLSATNFLCKNSQVLRKLTDEIRQLGTEEEIRLSKLNHLPYLTAVIRETHRLCPPLSNGPSRVVGPHDA
ncbi:hypothetical protein G7Y89_g13264 [Cudoniella acicularis]|uniref:Cytochrome P450 n=1 Tax=Cudoniella acicularis TaxID=354080 RepID=A0A8H4R7L9_9HELO|nr:hypothetical protein G7Y89_g13264 [Cudoniella acicularis]